MEITKSDLIPILSQLNPWWKKEGFRLPSWKRAAYKELFEWVFHPPADRAILLAGARQVGKTTLILQSIHELIKKGVPPQNILYASFDHPIFKIAGLEAVLSAWREFEPKQPGEEYVFLDEAQFLSDFGTWVKHQVDFNKGRRIIFTGSASPLANSNQESGVGRWHTIRVPTLSFYEYLNIKQIKIPEVDSISNIADLYEISETKLHRLSEDCEVLVGYFHEYLTRGGFPQAALVADVDKAQQLIREDIIDKVLKRDMTAIFGVRRILELEQLYIYFCLHDGGMQDIQTLSSNLGLNRNTVLNYINLLETTHLIYKLLPFGYGKEVLRGKYKIYLADPAISPSILLKGRSLLEDSKALGASAEVAVTVHVSNHCHLNYAKLSYWKGVKDREVDLILEKNKTYVPLEIKYQSGSPELKDLLGLREFSDKHQVHNRYVITKSAQDIGLIPGSNVMRIPAALLCYWIGKAESEQKCILIN